MLITVTGPESSGKTALATALSKEFSARLVPEYAREFLSELGRTYAEADLLEIAKGQIAAIEQTRTESDEMIISDTGLLVILLWSKWKYGSVDQKIVRLYLDHQPDVYVLCRPDLPWEYDPLRESPDDREALFDLYYHEVSGSGVPFIIAQSTGVSREEAVSKQLRSLQNL